MVCPMNHLQYLENPFLPNAEYHLGGGISIWVGRA